MEPENEAQTILIVDDEEDVVKPIIFRLEMQGFDVLMEADGETGFQTALAEMPDLILLDIMMPGIDGLTLCQILKERPDTAHIPIIMLTAKTTMGGRGEGLCRQSQRLRRQAFRMAGTIGENPTLSGV